MHQILIISGPSVPYHAINSLTLRKWSAQKNVWMKHSKYGYHKCMTEQNSIRNSFFSNIMVYFEWSMSLHRCGEIKKINYICLFERKKIFFKSKLGFYILNILSIFLKK